VVRIRWGYHAEEAGEGEGEGLGVVGHFRSQRSGVRGHGLRR